MALPVAARWMLPSSVAATVKFLLVFATMLMMQLEVPVGAHLACQPGAVNKFAFQSRVDKSIVDLKTLGRSAGFHGTVSVSDMHAYSVESLDGVVDCLRVLEVEVEPPDVDADRTSSQPVRLSPLAFFQRGRGQSTFALCDTTGMGPL